MGTRCSQSILTTFEQLLAPCLQRHPLRRLPQQRNSRTSLFSCQTSRAFASKKKIKTIYKPTSAPTKSRSHTAREADVPSPSARSFQPTRATTIETQQFPVPPNNLYAQTLALKPSPTLLYTHKSGNARAFTRAALGGFIGSVALLNIHDVFFFPNPGIWWLVPWMNLVYCVPILIVGSYIATRRMRPITSITAVPVDRGLKLVINGPSGKIPFLGIRVWKTPCIECAVNEAELTKDTMHHALPISPHERRVVVLGDSTDSSYSLKKLFAAIVRFFNTEMLMQSTLGLFVKGDAKRNRWDLDVKSAWMLDDGRALEKLLLKGRR